MSAKRESPRRITLAMMKGTPIAISVPAIRYHASDDEIEELYLSGDEEKRLTPDMDKNSPHPPSSPAKSSDKKAVSAEDVNEEVRADSSLQDGTPPASDPWKVFSEIKGKITKTFEEKLCEIKSDKRRKSRSPKENSSISDSEDPGDVTPSEENSIDKQKKELSAVRRRGIASHYVGFSRIKTGLKDKASREQCVESGVEAAEYAEDTYEGLVFGLETDIQHVEKTSLVTATSTNGAGTTTIKTPVQMDTAVPVKPTEIDSIFPQLTDQLIYPLAYRSTLFLIVALSCYYFTPLPESILGFVMGVFVTVTFFNAVATVRKIFTRLPEENLLANRAVPVLEIPAVEEHAVVERFEGWINELPYKYDPDDYHVARTKSVFFRLEGEILRIMETRMKIPKRAVWDEPRHKLKFTKRRAYCLAGAQIELLPQGLIRRRRWSKKYPICITLKKEALISNVILKRYIKDRGIQYSERIRRKVLRKRKGLRRRRIVDKEDEEKRCEHKGKENENSKEDREKKIGTMQNEGKEKRKSYTDETTESSAFQDEEDGDEEDDDTLDGDDFDEELELDEDDAEYDDEEDEDDELQWEAEMDELTEVDGEEEWHDVNIQRSPVHTMKQRKCSERSEEGYEDVKEVKLDGTDSDAFTEVDGNKISKDKNDNEEDKSSEHKPTASDGQNNGRDSGGGEKDSLQTVGLKKMFREHEGHDGDNTEMKLYIFTRTDREKEDWYRRLVSAASGQSTTRNHSPSTGDIASNLSNSVNNTKSKLFTSMNHSSDTSSDLSYKAYMAKYLDGHSSSLAEPTSSIYADDVLWFNGLIARILFDMHKCPETISLIQDRLQRKLSNIKLPYFMECLLVSELVIGQGAPVIRSVKKPVIDERGLWLDLDITYKGSLTMTVETKVNLMKLTRAGSISSNTSDVLTADKQKPSTKSPIFDSDVEDTPETSTEDEDSAKMRVCGTTKEAPAPSSGRKFLSMVDRIAANKYFQHATELSYVRRAMEGVSNTEIRLMVTVSGIEGSISVNIPPPPTDRLWYGFKPVPKISLTVVPAVGERAVNIVYVTKWIETKLLREFEKLVVLPNMDDLVLPLCPNYPYTTE